MSITPAPDDKGQVYLQDGTPLRQADGGPGPADQREASAAWLEEAEAMRALGGGFVTQDQALAYSIAYGIQALLGGQDGLLEGLACPVEPFRPED